MGRTKKNGRGGRDRASFLRGGGKNRPSSNSEGFRAERHNAAEANAPSAAFLAALEAQRAKQAAEEAHRNSTGMARDDSAPTPYGRGQAGTASQPAALPGFYFDKARGRFFKLTKHHEQAQKRRLAEEHTFREEKGKNVNHKGVTKFRRRGWLGILVEREIRNGVFSRCRDQRDIIPSYLSSQLASKLLAPVDVEINGTRDRFTAMDVSSDSSVLCIGSASGQLRSYSATGDSNRCFTLSPTGAVDMDAFMVTSVRCCRNNRGVLMSAIGSGIAREFVPLLSRRSSGHHSGRVALYHDETYRLPPLLWPLDDPWIAEWCPTEASLFSVGLNGHKGAAIVDHLASSHTESVTMSPQGRIKSDTLSQSFSQHASTIIVNGTRNGSWWTWDTRSPKRAMEVSVGDTLSTAGILCLRALSDDRRLVIHKSDGELVVIDLRSSLHQAVTLLVKGDNTVYRPMLRFDTDESESMIAATTMNSIALFNMSSGIMMNRVGIVSSCESEQGLEQVIFRSGESRNTLWSLSRTTVYRSSS